jgi:hypothetical protein
MVVSTSLTRGLELMKSAVIHTGSFRRTEIIFHLETGGELEINFFAKYNKTKNRKNPFINYYTVQDRFSFQLER